MAPPLPMVPCKACAIGLGGATVGSPVWGVEMQHIEKQRERGGALALGGRRLIMANNNQPKVGGSGRWDVIEERVGRGSTGGYTVQSFGVANGTTKK